MKTFTTAITMALVVTLSAALNPAEFEMCSFQYPCTQARGLIHYDYSIMNPYQKYLFGGRSWVIRPTYDDTKTSVTIVFKEVYITDSVYVITSGDDGTNWQRIRPETDNKFEIVASNVSAVTVYIPPTERGRFQAFYYVGCTVLTHGSEEINFPSMEHIIGIKNTCWIIKPVEVPDRRRIYLTMRDVYLISGARIAIEDLHTNIILAWVNETTSYDVYGTDTLGSETILVDLECGNKAGTCERFGNLFSLSYYAVTDRDVACIETQKQCALDRVIVPQQQCNQACPMLEHILEEEYKKEEPVLKSAALKATVKRTESVEEHRNGTQKKEQEEEERQEEREEEEEEEEEQDVRIAKRPPTKSKPKGIRCQLSPTYCKCLRTEDHLRKYCFSKRKCTTYDGCSMPCIFARITKCKEFRASHSIRIW